MLLYALMALSLSWSIDFGSTAHALGKEVSLLLIPLCFCLGTALTQRSRKAILRNYSYGMVAVGVYFLGRAFFRYIDTADVNVFFYHELSTNNVNAIYLSAMFSMALFYFVADKSRSLWKYIALVFLTGMIFLLSSKLVIAVDVAMIGIYYLFFSGMSKRMRIASIAVFCAVAIALGYYGKIKERIVAEYRPNTEQQMSELAAAIAGTTYKVSIKDAYTKEKFGSNAYFNGTAFRVYQIRIFLEMLREDGILFTGYGLNASMEKIEAKGVEHDLYGGEESHYAYNKQNFHNQYVQVFADLGIFGFLLLIWILGINLKNSFKNKDFTHIAFAILMIALFLTESFIWRQRGIVLFITFYCLFNTALLPKAREKEEL